MNQPIDRLLERLRTAGIRLTYAGGTQVRFYPPSVAQNAALISELYAHRAELLAALQLRERLANARTCEARYNPQRVPPERLYTARCKRCGAVAAEHLTKEPPA